MKSLSYYKKLKEEEIRKYKEILRKENKKKNLTSRSMTS